MPIIKKFLRGVYISIHAPVWGATEEIYCRCILNDISIHAPVWGATKMFTIKELKEFISIHAPVWGATFQCSKSTISPLYFNSRSRVGSDLFSMFLFYSLCNFNSRSRVGSDDLSSTRTSCPPLFQFTLPCGERLMNYAVKFYGLKFQFTLPCGERRNSCIYVK